ncbi:MAG: agmatine deiminase family protein, partial [Sedimentisphaerales bacterium]|nr:agmatine deiminase family protein [Sedimentisphaerales bacterium]
MKRFLTTAKVKTMVHLLTLCSLIVFASAAQVHAYYMPPELVEELQSKYPEGLPRYMTPEEQQWLDQLIVPLGIQPPGATMPPTGATWTPAEYEPLAGVLVRWTSGTTYDCLPPFVAEVSQTDTDANVWCFIESSSEQTAATTAFTNAGANMSKVTFITYNSDSIWIRDYGPRYFYVNNNHAIMDHVYNRSGRPNDDGLPTFLANYWSDPCYGIGLWHGGGNFHAFSDGNGFSSNLILNENPAYTADDINDIFRDYFNVKLTIFPRLPSSIDATGHIDMWFLPLSPTKVLISQFTSGEGQTITNNAAAVLQARGYTVYRTPAWNSSGTHYTYTNAAIVNNKVFISLYSSYSTENAQALSTFQSAMPGYEIIQIDTDNIIGSAGAIHCIMKHVYQPKTPVPTVEVVWPNGDETLQPGAQEQIEWVASDDASVTSVDLYYSTNAGSTWTTIATGLSNTGSYNWTVPSTSSTQCRIRAVAHDGASNTRADVSDKNFAISSSDPPVGIIGNWVTGLNHPKEIGNNRQLIVFAYAEGSTTVDLTGMTYGGRTMTQINEMVQGTSTYVYTAAYRLGEADINLATSGTIVPTWTGTRTSTNYISVFLSDVIQTVPVGPNAVSGGTTATITTSALATSNGDLVLDAATHSETGTYTVNNSFTEVNEPAMSSSDAVVGYKLATGAAETPSVTHSGSTHRQSLIGFVIKHATGAPPVTRTLTVSSSSGGTVTTPGIGNFNYPVDSYASIVAANDVNYSFVNWTGTAVTAGKVANPTAASTTVTMDANYTVQANFVV